MALELYLKPGFGRRLRRVTSTAGLRHILDGLWTSLTNYGTPAVAVKPVNTAAPAITPASAVPGATLTCSTGTWTGGGSIAYTYVWKNGGTPIGGATTNSITGANVTAGAITCEVTATNSAGATMQVSNSVAVA